MTDDEYGDALVAAEDIIKAEVRKLPQSERKDFMADLSYDLAVWVGEGCP